MELIIRFHNKVDNLGLNYHILAKRFDLPNSLILLPLSGIVKHCVASKILLDWDFACTIKLVGFVSES